MIKNLFPFLFGAIFLFGKVALADTVNNPEFSARGWLWYNSEEDEKKDVHQKEDLSMESLSGNSSDPAIQLQTFHKNFERIKARAVLHPNYENVHTFIIVQKKLTERSDQFKAVYMSIFGKNSELIDQTLPDGRRIHDDSIQQNALLKKFETVKHYLNTDGRSLIFFYKGECPHCKKMAPMAARFFQKMAVPYVAITLDGNVLKEFPQSIANRSFSASEFSRFKLHSVPSIVVAEKDGSGVALEGAMSATDLIERLFRVIPKLGMTS